MLQLCNNCFPQHAAPNSLLFLSFFKEKQKKKKDKTKKKTSKTDIIDYKRTSSKWEPANCHSSTQNSPGFGNIHINKIIVHGSLGISALGVRGVAVAVSGQQNRPFN